MHGIRMDVTETIREETSNLREGQPGLGKGATGLTMLVTPFMAYHEAFLYVCSLRLHHIWVMAIKVGAVKRISEEPL